VRINVYSQELTTEVLPVSKRSNTGIEYKAVQFVLHSSPMLHHPPQDDDRSAVTFWLPQSAEGLEEAERMFFRALEIVKSLRYAARRTDSFSATYDANARRRGQYDEPTPGNTEAKP
jgi:hypothetical protein